MPNGYDKNWVRFCAVVDGFRLRFGRWPTVARLDPLCLDDLRKHLFSPDSFSVLEEKIQFTAEPDCFEVADGEGRRYSYWEEGFPDRRPEVTAHRWLGVTPDLH